MSPSRNCRVIAIVNQKGGVNKSTLCTNLACGLVRDSYKALVIDMDPQGTGSMMLGIRELDDLQRSTATVLSRVVNEEPLSLPEAILTTVEGADLIPANIDLASMDVRLVSVLNRERILKQIVDPLRKDYDCILIDCPPSLGMLTINALTAADSVIIPTLAEYPSARGLVQLLKTVGRVRRSINPSLKIDGIVLTMVDERTNYNRNIAQMVTDAYGTDLRVYKTTIPKSIKIAEAGAYGKSVFLHCPNSRVAIAYLALIKEVEESWQNS